MILTGDRRKPATIAGSAGLLLGALFFMGHTFIIGHIAGHWRTRRQHRLENNVGGRHRRAVLLGPLHLLLLRQSGGGQMGAPHPDRRRILHDLRDGLCAAAAVDYGIHAGPGTRAYHCVGRMCRICFYASRLPLIALRRCIESRPARSVPAGAALADRQRL
ncbi:MAG: hypothetical protein MZV63_28865 [Marinilabiliales bacterium]|nr:hypothetical protein [Marinilabiliales bacterium]